MNRPTFIAKGCRKCGGDLRFYIDLFGSCHVCYQCGKNYDENALPEGATPIIQILEKLPKGRHLKRKLLPS